MEDFVSISEAAKLLNMTVGGVHHLIKVGTIKAERTLAQYMIPKSELPKAANRRGKGRPRGS